MRLAISNIAWDVIHDDAVATRLASAKIDAIDVAPGKYFADLERASDADIRAVRRWWADRGIEITGMQSLLFGTVGLNVFGPAAVRAAMLSRLDAVCRVGAGLGAPRLVFGSPKNRLRGGLSDEQTREVAGEFFRRVGDIATSHGVVVCLEPNPTRYGADFMTHSDETAAVVRLVDHPAIRMQFDSGALTLNGEQADQVLDRHAALVGHVHASEPDLVPLGDGATDHAAMAGALAKYLPGHVVSIEMVAPAHESHLTAIERALKVAVAHYRQAGNGPSP
ncbi:MAG: sugar phosphate isomerase/epimerase [Pseudomonadota bacterium]|nr:sugar phosphate isomerase/epimerase [Pseudomonadota bacterium]